MRKTSIGIHRHSTLSAYALFGLLICLVVSPRFLFAAERKESFLETVENLNIKYNESTSVFDQKTNEIDKMVFSGDVHFVLDEADLYSDQLEVIEGAGKEKRVVVATANKGNRVIIYLPSDGVMALCDKFTYYPEDRVSILTGDPVTYRVTASGLIRSAGETMRITRTEDQTRIHSGSGSMQPTTPEKEDLSPDLKKRLADFAKKCREQKNMKSPSQSSPPKPSRVKRSDNGKDNKVKQSPKPPKRPPDAPAAKTTIKRRALIEE